MAEELDVPATSATAPRPNAEAPLLPVPDLIVSSDETLDEATNLRAELRRLSKLAYLLCGNSAMADDAAAEALARVWRRSQAGDIENRRAYARRTLVNHLSSTRRRRMAEERALVVESGGDNTHRIDDAAVASADISRALRALPMDQRVVVVLRYFEDMSESEIATTLRIRPGTVKSRASRGLAALRTSLEGGQDV